ncbi:sn-glycerol 3-phosphate transport system permease protein (plasmid) [Legionella adelaidensis]|uniref:sn-glycerol-3-phosphate transport system permease protein UgpA n=1 Tax=Legionella adelaidensis TaxID=45056 RepID=A0A0W0R4M8_9GAMM|nr:ABC transporter permease subunit [Legionella adelaidensis]KTC65991.1 sn-glycerol-3-phosphate transmembrane ABC transporter [Legionella adelaidensis]VEH86315.1 sn-glycerol 3-phosphate transport system permease protein [Legionella adelaidensis]
MSKFTQKRKKVLWFIVPQLLFTLLFFLWPAFNAIVQSFFYSDAFGLHRHFAGIGNYFEIIFSAEYGYAVWVTFVIAFAITLLTTSFGLSLALLVNRRTKSHALYKSLLLWPYAVAPAIAAILWRFLCHPTLGWLTHLLQKCGIDFNYVIHPYQALLVIILSASWQQFSYNFLFYLAALKMIPNAIQEAAIIDGASSWHRFWQIIFPLLSPTTFFLITMNVIYAFFDTFGVIDILTNGGPEYATSTLVYKAYKDGFIGMDFGSSSAQSIILIVLVVLLTMLQFRYLEKKVHYQ